MGGGWKGAALIVDRRRGGGRGGGAGADLQAFYRTAPSYRSKLYLDTLQIISVFNP